MDVNLGCLPASSCCLWALLRLLEPLSKVFFMFVLLDESEVTKEINKISSWLYKWINIIQIK